MARFRLTTQHVMVVQTAQGLQPTVLEAGAEVEVEASQITPHMIALDPQGEELLKNACDTWRAGAVDGGQRNWFWLRPEFAAVKSQLVWS